MNEAGESFKDFSARLWGKYKSHKLPRLYDLEAHIQKNLKERSLEIEPWGEMDTDFSYDEQLHIWKKGTDDYLDSAALLNLVGVWTPVSYRFSYTAVPPPYSSYVFGSWPWDEKPKEPAQDSAPFELNLTEALVGWREWRIDKDVLVSMVAGENNRWVPDTPMCAKCNNKWPHPVPSEFCTCGFYAKDLRPKDNDGWNGDRYDRSSIVGEVFGWGRYVRGDNGWRSEYAYPKSFYLTKEQATPDTFEILKKYHVPIYVEQPMLFYDPQEDGYANRDNEEDGDFGASEVPDAT